MRLEYKEGLPTEEGWYFVSMKGNPFPPAMVEVYLSVSGLRIRQGVCNGDAMAPTLLAEWKPENMWAGPIQAPEMVPLGSNDG